MSVEVALFLGLAGLAIIAAVMMLISENAVHSALFLIVNFASVAVLYLMLDAAFLAMVQLAVYAGAIMVLFLFVIMLLGAEKVGGEGIKQFRWLSPLALTLALAFLIAISAAFSSGRIDSREIPPAAPLLRVAHFAPAYTDPVDIYLNDELVVPAMQFGQASGYRQLQAGEYSLGIGIPGTQNVLPLGHTVSLAGGEVVTVVAYGEGRLPLIATINDDLSPIFGREGRVTFFNAYTGAPEINILDPGPDFAISPDENLRFFAEGLAFGASTEIATLNRGAFRLAALTPANDTLIIARLTDFEVSSETANLVALAAVPDAIEEGLLRPALYSFATTTTPPVGGPKAIGQSLFTKYVLPFQMVAMLLLAAMVGAIVLTQRGDVKPKPGRPTRRKVSRPLTSVIASQTGHEVMQPKAAPPQLQSPEKQDAQPEPEAGD